MAKLTPKQILWDFFAQDHNLNLLDSELHEIELAVGAYLASEPGRAAVYEAPFHAVRYPDGHIDHCTIRMDAKDAIKEFIETEIVLNMVCNQVRVEKGKKPRCAKSWEQYEAEGMSVVPVRISEIKP